MPLTERVSFRTTPNRFRKIPHIEGEYLELWSYSNAAQSKQELEGRQQRNEQWNVLADMARVDDGA
jgi:hypothetical protein